MPAPMPPDAPVITATFPDSGKSQDFASDAIVHRSHSLRSLVAAGVEWKRCAVRNQHTNATTSPRDGGPWHMQLVVVTDSAGVCSTPSDCTAYLPSSYRCNMFKHIVPQRMCSARDLEVVKLTWQGWHYFPRGTHFVWLFFRTHPTYGRNSTHYVSTDTCAAMSCTTTANMRPSIDGLQPRKSSWQLKSAVQLLLCTRAPSLSLCSAAVLLSIRNSQWQARPKAREPRWMK